jgi:hypothetical protein
MTTKDEVAPEAVEPSQQDDEITGESTGFNEENTSDYQVPSTFNRSSARSEISMDSPGAIEDTRELEVPQPLKPRRGVREIPLHVREQWESHGRVAGRFRQWFFSDPVVAWYYTLPEARRRLLSWAAWITASAATIVIVFATSSMGIFPIVEEMMRPTFAPRPEKPERLFPRPGAAFDLVELRELSSEEFRLATDCLWITVDPGSGYILDNAGVALELKGKKVAELDVRYNWDGLVRLYFGAGKVPSDKDLMIRLPVERGGMWSLQQGANYETFLQGGRTPSHVMLGPIRFSE